MATRNRPIGRAFKKGTGPKTIPPFKPRAEGKPPGANPPKSKPSPAKR